MPALDRITIEGFKSIRFTDLQLGRINVLIGANGAGKSNFLEVFSLLRAIRKGKLQDYVARTGGAEKTLHFGSRTTKRMKIVIRLSDGHSLFDILLAPADNDSLYLKAEAGRDNGKTSLEADMSNIGGPLPDIRRCIDDWRLHHFHDSGISSPMRKTSDLHDNRYLRSDGSNLAAFLYLLREKHPDSYGMIRHTVRLAAPFFDDFQLEPLAPNVNTIKLEWLHRRSDACFDASSLSDGTLRFITLAALLLQPASLRPSVVLMDETELGLHPFTITLLASLVRRASAETQVILATQSPILLDHFEPEDVLVANREGGTTDLTRLEPERLKDWLNEYSLGQLWEKNELGGRPASEA